MTFKFKPHFILYRLIELNRAGKLRVPPDRLYGLSRFIAIKLAGSGSALSDEMILLAAAGYEGGRPGGGAEGLPRRRKVNTRRMKKAGHKGRARIFSRRVGKIEE